MTETSSSALEIRRGEDRGTTQFDWLYSRHSFSFGRFREPDRMSFRSLRVLNDDVIAGGGGFGEHPHDNMEIISWMLAGALEHADSTGTRGVIRPGDVQVMTAGRGIRHSEVNASATETAHLLQIWIMPAERDLTPGYQQKRFPEEGRRNHWQALVSPDGRNGSLKIHQDAIISVVDLATKGSVDVAIGDKRHGYLHIATGAVEVNRLSLEAGDAATCTGPSQLRLQAQESSQILLFDLI